MAVNKKKVALITGVTGQDGSYLAEFLLNKDYLVHGIKRRSSSFNTGRIDHIYEDPHEDEDNRCFTLHYGDLTDSTNLIRIIKTVQPDEIYNLAAQSHVAVSFETPEYTANCDALGTLRVLEAIRTLNLIEKTKFSAEAQLELIAFSGKREQIEAQLPDLRKKEISASSALQRIIVEKENMIFTPPMVEHCMKFPIDTLFLTLSRNPRDQKTYEEDVVRTNLIEPGESITWKPNES